MFEKSDILNSPVDCVFFDASKEDFPIRSHWHYFMEIIYVHKGVININSDSKKYIVHPGEMIIFPPKISHSIDSEDTPSYSLLKFDINRIKIDNSLSLNSLFNGAIDKYPVIHAEDCKNMMVKEIIENCIKEMDTKEYGYTSIIYSFVYILLTRIIQIWKKENYVFKPTKVTIHSIYTISEYIDEHLSDNIRIEDLAKICGMSYSYFAKNFKELYRQSCKDFINGLRIEKACDLLMFTNYDMNQISLEVGFSDASHFIRTFNQIKKVTPKQFRIKYLKGATK